MIFCRYFLQTLSVCALIFSYQGLVDCAYAEDASGYVRVTICPEGEYVAACGNYRVGFNWLKPATISETNTKNYYISNEITDLYQQMRTFFDKDATIIQYLNDDETITNNPDFAVDRKAILDTLCNPKKSEIRCLPCPNNAEVPESTVYIKDADQTRDWDFHTFADCYMTEFEDSTGSYFYVPDDRNIDSTNEHNAEKCYYQNTTADAVDILGGTSIGTFVPGIYHLKTDMSNTTFVPKTKITKY